MAVGHAVEPNAYLQICYKQQNVSKGITDFALVNVHTFFEQKHSTSQDDTPMKVLDYGCGPVLAYSTCAAGANAEIVLAEYGEKCRSALQDWLDRSPSAWDWTPYIKHVICDLEGKDETEVDTRKETLRKAIKAIVPCDITQDPPIAKGYEGPYDVVMSMLCIEHGCLTRQEYKAAVKRIATLVKREGNLLIHSTIRNREEGNDTPGYYYINEKKHIEVALSLQFVLMTLKECGFSVIETNKLPEKESNALSIGEERDLDSTAFIIAKKL
jgi:2-polyprenyl-3-methyl-5-hydroxy-6-metoxy-1,4-benzoquinol methylase